MSIEYQVVFSTNTLLVLDLIHREQRVPEDLSPELKTLLEQGIIERMGRGRGVRYLLSRRLFSFLGRGGVYTRTKGLDKETNKALLLKHLKDNQKYGSKLKELNQVLPAASRRQIQVLLREMLREGDIHVAGKTNAALWYPGPRREM